MARENEMININYMPEPALEMNESGQSSLSSPATSATSSPAASASQDDSQEQGQQDASADDQIQSIASQKELDPEQNFDEFYLKQATREFANDLEKLRSAGDFGGEKTVDVLIDALKQGRACFAAEERRRIGLGAADAT